ncbi:MAG: hypothetical protein EB015_15075, partial [Methylocystaceae bacterium]|nr:hypothetical protein [Methylocystaceae bacterium]
TAFGSLILRSLLHRQSPSDGNTHRGVFYANTRLERHISKDRDAKSCLQMNPCPTWQTSAPDQREKTHP